MGSHCMQDLAQFAGGGNVIGPDCAWGARFAEWLQSTFPAADVKFKNLAVGGMPASFFATDVSRYITPSTDLVILDSLINDFAQATHVKLEEIPTSITAAALESLVLSIREAFPKVVILDVLLVPSWCMFTKRRIDTALQAHLIVMEHYNVAVFNLSQIIDHQVKN